VSPADGSVGLDAEQSAAVRHGVGPALVVAGPGAGKTRVLTYRVQHLVNSGVRPEAIFVCTFTKKATGEMESRLTSLIGSTSTSTLALGTIHAQCYRLLREHWRNTGHKSKEVVGDATCGYLANLLLDRKYSGNEIGMELSTKKLRADDLLHFFSACRDRLYLPDAVPAEEVPALVGPRWVDIRADCRFAGVSPATAQDWIDAYELFQAAKASKNSIDFDDMNVLLWQAWQIDPALLATHQERFSHVLVDECQDTSWGQWKMLQLLVTPRNNLFAVGDIDQSMYGFRFAQPQLTMNFTDTYPTAIVYRVQTNYRSVSQVVGTSSKLISRNKARLDLTLRPHRTDLGSLSLLDPDNPSTEAESIAKEIVSSGKWSDIAVLYRTNSYSAYMELALIRHGVPYRIVGGMSFFAFKAVSDILNYLRLADDHTNGDAFKAAIVAPTRMLGREYINSVLKRGGDLLVAAVYCDSTLNQMQLNRVDDFTHILCTLPESPVEAIKAIRNLTHYDAWYLTRGVNTGSDGTADDNQTGRVEILDELEQVAAGFDSITALIAYADLIVDELTDAEDDDARVTLSTIHRAKGLEWPTVYVIGMSEGLLPHSRAKTTDDIEEERRIAYVAMTRARDKLVLSSPAVIGKEVEPSRFLYEAGVL